MTKSQLAPFFAFILLGLSACGKEQPTVAPTPDLVTPSEHLTGMPEKVAAQAEVRASSGPVELTFLLHKTQIKVGESLWQQLRIRNVGGKEILVADPVFQDLGELRKQSRSGYGIYLEAFGPDGKPLKIHFLRSAARESHIMNSVSGLLEVEGPKEQAMLDGWIKQGLSPHEINLKLIDFNTKKQQATAGDQQQLVIELRPGQSIETKSWFFYSMQDKLRNRPTPRPIGDFAQLDFLVFEKPGKYKVRAVYDHQQSALARKAGIAIYPHNVLIRTPWIAIEVLP